MRWRELPPSALDMPHPPNLRLRRPQDVADLLDRMLSQDPVDRPNAQEVCTGLRAHSPTLAGQAACLPLPARPSTRLP